MKECLDGGGALISREGKREYKMRWGFYFKNEILNGRGAMIFLITIILLEIFPHKTIINLIFQGRETRLEKLLPHRGMYSRTLEAKPLGLEDYNIKTLY